MEELWQGDIDLPVSVRNGLERFCKQLKEALGDSLLSVVLYGGLAKGDQYHARTSDVNVMVLLKEVTVEILDKAASPIRKGSRAFGLSAMVLSENDLRSSTDVFPIKFMDIKKHHLVLWGKDALTELPIGEEHLRLRCEQEIKNLLLRLRAFYVRRAHRSSLIESTLTTAVSSFLYSLSAFLILKTGHAPALKADIAEAAAEELDLDKKTLQDILALKSGRLKQNRAELKRLYDSFMATIQKAADVLDHF